MRLDPIGVVEHPEQIDLEPITIPVVGYRIKDRKPVEEEFNFHASRPWGVVLALFESETEKEFAERTIGWLSYCMLSYEERVRWKAFLLREDIAIAQSTVEEVYKALAETYAGRPTLPLSDSSGGGKRTKQTSRAGSRARASVSNGSDPS